MKVAITPERKEWVNNLLAKDPKITKALINSLVGVLEFLSVALPYIKLRLNGYKKDSTILTATRKICHSKHDSAFIGDTSRR